MILVSGQNDGSRRKASNETRGRVMSSRCYALYSGGIYQLNVDGLGSLEVICRRTVVLVETHSQPNRPNWAVGRSAHERRGHPARVAILRRAACQRGCGHPERSAKVLH